MLELAWNWNYGTSKCLELALELVLELVLGLVLGGSWGLLELKNSQNFRLRR